MNKKLLIGGVAGLLVIGAIGYSIFSGPGDTAPSTFKGNLGAINFNVTVPTNSQAARQTTIHSFFSKMNNADFQTRYKAGTTLMGGTICFTGTTYYQELTQQVNGLDAINTRLRVNSQSTATFDRERATIANDLSALGYSLSTIGAFADMAAASPCTRHIPPAVMDYLFGGVLRRNAAIYVSDLNELNRLYTAITR